jgi:hypothetical protein
MQGHLMLAKQSIISNFRFKKISQGRVRIYHKICVKEKEQFHLFTLQFEQYKMYQRYHDIKPIRIYKE